MNTQNDGVAKLSPEMLAGVTGGTTNPADLDLILQDFKAKNPGAPVEDLLDTISSFQHYAIEMDGDVRPFRFYYDADSPEMTYVLSYIKTNF